MNASLAALSLVLTILATLIGFGFCLRAFALANQQTQANNLRLAAANLVEPLITISILLLGFLFTNGTGSEKSVLLVAGVPLTLLLLAPLVVGVQAGRGLLIFYGVARWLNTIALWWLASGSVNFRGSADVGFAFIGFGTLLLCLSVFHIAATLAMFAPNSRAIV